MAQICEQCGKKISVFSNDFITIGDEHILCYECGDYIRKMLIDLNYTKTKSEFDLLKAEILENSHKIYNEALLQIIERRIDEIYNNSSIKNIEKQTTKKELIENYMLTTGYEFVGYKIKNYVGVISGQVVLGTGFLSELTASFADFFGEESDQFADKLETAKNAAIEKLIIKSADKGGNAIIGVDFDYITFRNNMIGVVANGTSVVIEKDEN